jgi:hypothetical protein
MHDIDRMRNNLALRGRLSDQIMTDLLTVPLEERYRLRDRITGRSYTHWWRCLQWFASLTPPDFEMNVEDIKSAE